MRRVSLFRVWTLSIFAARRELERVPRFQHSQSPSFRVWTLSNFAARRALRPRRADMTIPEPLCWREAAVLPRSAVVFLQYRELTVETSEVTKPFARLVLGLSTPTVARLCSLDSSCRHLQASHTFAPLRLLLFSHHRRPFFARET